MLLTTLVYYNLLLKQSNPLSWSYKMLVLLTECFFVFCQLKDNANEQSSSKPKAPFCFFFRKVVLMTKLVS